MPVTERMMKCGDFDIKFTDALPLAYRERMQLHGHIVITPSHSSDNTLDRSQILPLARYTGVIMEKDEKRTHYSGTSILMWLGDDRNPQQGATRSYDIPGGVPTTMTWENFLDGLWNFFAPTDPDVRRDAANGLYKGTVYADSVTTLDMTQIPSYTSARVWLDAIAALLNCEYRVTPDGFFHSGLFNSGVFRTTPQVIVTEGPESHTGNLISLQATTPLDQIESARDYSASVVVTGTGANAFAIAPVVPYDFTGDRLIRMVLNIYDDSIVDTAWAQYRADYERNTRGLYTSSVQDITVRHEDIGRILIPGDWMYIYDPLSGLHNQAYPIESQGQVIIPAYVRVFGYTWKITPNFKVYYLATADGSNAMIDLTPYVEWESGDVTIEVGQPHKSFLQILGFYGVSA